jgi:hypothetical protein
MVDDDVVNDNIIADTCDNVDEADYIVGNPCKDVDKAKNGDGVDNELTKRERAVLGFFIAQIRV